MSNGCDNFHKDATHSFFSIYGISFSNDRDEVNDEIQATHHWLVKLMPSDPDLRDIVLRHDLFKKEMLVHQVVITKLHSFVEKKRGNWKIAKIYDDTLYRVNRVQIIFSYCEFTLPTFYWAQIAEALRSM